MTTPSNRFVESGNEDAFFIHRDCRELFQRRVAEAIRPAGASPAMVEAFAAALAESYDEFAASAGRDGFDEVRGLTSSRMTLMGDDDLELEIRIGDIVRRLAERGGSALWRVHTRYMTLMNRPELKPDDDPVGPEVISAGLWAICRADAQPLDARMAVLDRVESALAEHLPVVYAELNDLLASRNVEPAQTQIVSSGGSRSAPIAPASAEGGAASLPGTADGAGALAALQSALARQWGGAAPAAVAGSPGASGGEVALNAATLVMLNQLAARLDQLEQKRWDTLAEAENSDSETGAGEPAPRALRSDDVEVPLGRSESLALDTLGHIFDEIFNIWELPDTVKTAIGRLQIPLLKMAIVDGSLFSDGDHLARTLINRMAHAAIGLPRDISRAHPVSSRLWKLASAVAEAQLGDAAALDAPLAELDGLIAGRDHDVQEKALPYLALFQEKELQDQAALAARRWLQGALAAGAPLEVLQFLQRDWVRVMAAACRDGGESGAAWQACATTAADLVWSVLAKQGADDRKRLAGMVPLLLKGLNAGLDRIDMPTGDRAPFLDACFTLQTNALRGNPAPVVRNEAPESVATGDDATAIEQDGRSLRLLGFATQPASAYSAASPVAVGDWLQFALGENDIRCGMVVWTGPRTGNVLLCNPDWGFGIAVGSAVLERQLRQGQARVVSGQRIFDIAAERALKQLAATQG